MIVRRVQLALYRALTGYTLQENGIEYQPLQQALAHMREDGTFPEDWTPGGLPGRSAIFPEKPVDNLKVYPFICLHNIIHPTAMHTQDVTVHDANGLNPESYPGLTCWNGEWAVYAEDKSDTSLRAEKLREIADAAMERSISQDALDFSLPEEAMDPVPARFRPIPPPVGVVLFRRSGLTGPYDEWYDGRRYWWRGLRYKVELQEEDPTHSSLR